MSSNEALRLSSRATIEIQYANPEQKYLGEVDCRLLFLGERYKRLLEVYPEVVRIIAEGGPPEAVAGALSAPPVSSLYDVVRSNGAVAVELRDDVFREQAPVDGLRLQLRVAAAGRAVTVPLPVERLSALGRLLPLLGGDLPARDVAAALAAGLEGEGLAWASGLLEELEGAGLVTRGAREPHEPLGSADPPSVTLLGHASLLFRSRSHSVVTDPLVIASGGAALRSSDALRLAPSAICISHSHWDHCNPQTLALFDKRTPVLVPRVERPTAFNPPMRTVLERLGFTEVHEARMWEPFVAGDVEVVPVPFHGEQDEPGAEIDHYTYVLRTEGLTVYGGVDSYRDTFGEMLPVLGEVRDRFRPEIAFLPISRMVYAYATGGVNGFCRALDPSLVGRSFQYTAGPEEVPAWVEALGARWVVPYASFAVLRNSLPPTFEEVRRVFAARGIGDRLFPLRPLETLAASELANPRRVALRRRLAVGQARASHLLTSAAPARGVRRVYRSARRRAAAAARGALSSMR